MLTIQQKIYYFEVNYPGLIQQLVSILEPSLTTIKPQYSSQLLQLKNIYGANTITEVLGYLKNLNSEVDLTQYTLENNNRFITPEQNILITNSVTSITSQELTPISNLIYKPISFNDIQYVKTKVSNSCWSNILGNLTTFYTSSLQHNKDFFINIYNENPDITDNELVQFSVAYGNYNGLGSSKIDSGSVDNTFTYSKVIYSQYKNVLGGTNNNKFVMDGFAVNDVFIVNISRNRLKQSIDVNNWELVLSGSNGNIYSFVDDSTVSTTSIQPTDIKMYNIVSGSLEEGINSNTIYGSVYPDFGVLVFNAKKLNEDGIVNVLQNINTSDNNHYTFLNAIKGGSNFLMRNEQELSTTYYSINVDYDEFNYSMNPSYVTGSLGDFKNTSFITDPYSYPTTIGLYNDNHDLLAIAKLPKPVKKDFYTEMNFYVKLDY